MRILVVDDNILDRKLIKNVIECETGLSVQTARDGLEALNKFKAQPYDLVVTDIVMPKIEGVELINSIQSIKPDTKIIAISGSNPYYLYIVKKIGIDSVFTKPIDINRFIGRVNFIKESLNEKVFI